MTDSNPHSPIKSLNTALHHLDGEPLSAEARQALEQVRLLSQSLFEENIRLSQEVLAANLAKSKFVSVVTHELRLPMTSIKGYTDLMRSGVVGPLNEQQVSFMNVIRNNIERMSGLVSDLSDLSHIESGRMKLNPTPTRLASAVDDLLLILKPRFDEKHQALDVQIPADLPKVCVDSARFNQVLTAVLNNANKYSPEGASVSLRVVDQTPFARIEVEDHGPGINEQDAPMVFTQFFRSEDPAIREQQGWGLNLSLARQLVHLMNGQIGFDSQPGVKTTFWITLPVDGGEKSG